MAYTPSGLSQADAEKLSKQQQDQINANKQRLKEGQLFYIGTGEGGKKLAQYSKGNLISLGYQQPLDWQGKTGGWWQNDVTGKAVNQLGINDNQIIDLTKDENYLWRDTLQGAKDNTVYNLSQFKSGMVGIANPGGDLTALPDVTPEQRAQMAQNLANPSLMNEGSPIKSAGMSFQQDSALGTPNFNLSQGTYIPNEQALQQKRQELTNAGVPQSEWSKFISSPDANGKIYWRQPATLYGPSGQKKVIATGSQEANDLFKGGWSLTKPLNENIISSDTMSSEPTINLGQGTRTNTFGADTVAGGFESSVAEAQKEVDRLEKLLTEGVQSENSKALDSLIAGLDPTLLTGRGAMQLSEEEKRGIEQKRQALLSKSAELKRKTDEINALTASYNLANQTEEGRPQTLSRLQGAQAQNYKMYLAQKNSLTADAAFIQSDLLAMQDQLTAAQEAANRAVDLAYADKESAYNATLQRINILSSQVDKEEKRYLAQIQLDLQDQQDKLAEAKANQKQIQDFKLQAISLKLPTSIVNQIGKSKTIEDAYRILVNNSPTKQSPPSWKQIGTDAFGNPTYGFVSEDSMSVTPYGGYNGPVSNSGPGVVTDASGASYDIGSYATDPNHETAVQSILGRIGKMTSVDQMNQYIQSVAPGSKVTGQMIANASQKYGVSWEAMMAIMQQDSSFGTAGAGARSFNPGNVGNTEQATSTGRLVNFGNWQSGVDAVAKNLAGRRVSGQQTTQNTFKPTGDRVLDGLVQNVLSNPSQWATLNDKQKQAVSNTLSSQGLSVPTPESIASQAKDQNLKQRVQDVLSLETHKGLNSNVGPSATKWFSRFKLGPDALGEGQDFLGKMDQLISEFSLESLIKSKAEGATFGALSDQELRVLSNAASPLGSWAIYKGTGENRKLVGFNVSEKRFKEALSNIANVLNNSIKNSELKNDNTFYDPLGIGTVNNVNSNNPFGL